MLPKNRVGLPREMTKGLFRPEYNPENTNLNNLLVEVALTEKKEKAVKSVKQRIQVEAGVVKPSTTGASGVPIPLTEEESEEADRQIKQALTRIQATRQKALYVREQVNAAIHSELGGKDLVFNVDVSKKRGVGRALRKLYGEPLETITHAMYLQLLEAKTLMEINEVAQYKAGKVKPEDQDDEDSGKKSRKSEDY